MTKEQLSYKVAWLITKVDYAAMEMMILIIPPILRPGINIVQSCQDKFLSVILKEIHR